MGVTHQLSEDAVRTLHLLANDLDLLWVGSFALLKGALQAIGRVVDNGQRVLDLVGDLRMIRWLMDGHRWDMSEISTVPKLGLHSSGNSGGILSRREESITQACRQNSPEQPARPAKGKLVLAN